ncbi:unnamed protein product [Lymnaea stagnalis]|uniref:Uncharacterized protein n=1 Tax=Lymnaea stagnalis TaxID=6523 RepID=A0AAV2IEU6_LYMST
MSSYILNKMDFSVSPCENMYLYACGGLHAKTKFHKYVDIYAPVITDGLFDYKVGKIIESNKSHIFGKHSSALVKMRSFYQTCMDEERLEEKSKPGIINVINELGSWTMTNVSVTPFDKKNWSLQETLMKLHKMGSFFFFCVGRATTTLDDTKQKKETLIFMRDESAVISYLNSGPIFRDLLISIAVKLAEGLGGDPEEAETKAKEIMEFLLQLENVEPTYTQPMPLKELQEQIGSSLDLKAYLNEFFGDEHNISMDTIIECYEMPYFISLGKALKQYEKSVVANVLVFKFLFGMTDYLPKDMLLPDRIFPRESLCRKSLLKFFAAPLIALYVQDYFKPETKVKVSSILVNIRKETVKAFTGLHWMDDKLKEALIRKAQLVEMDPAYPDWILDQVTLDKVYEKAEIFPEELLKSVISIRKEIIRQRFQLKPHSPTISWEHMPFDDYAFFNARLLTINITISYLQPPIYSPLFPISFQYGSLGRLIGHEFMHPFDIGNRRVDRNLLPISPGWTSSANESFMAGVSCLVDLYSSCTYDGIRANGYKAVNEDVCDNEGLKLAYRAYKSLGKVYDPRLPGLNLTDDQMFFLAFSQSYCIIDAGGKAKRGGKHNAHRIRALGTISNSEEFAKAFNCPADSPMNPKKKCPIY